MKSIKEGFAEVVKIMEARPPVTVLEKERLIVITTGMPNYSYEIPFDRIDTAPKLLAWVMQITGKRWCTVKILASLIGQCSQRFGIKIEYC
jgi:hypothetical protein